LQLDVAMSDHTDHMDHMSNPTPALNPSFLGVHACNPLRHQEVTLLVALPSLPLNAKHNEYTWFEFSADLPNLLNLHV